MYSVNCVKCGAAYQSADPDPYYCKPCDAIRKEVAAEIDRKHAALPKREAKSAMQVYDEAPKAHGFILYQP